MLGGLHRETTPIPLLHASGASWMPSLSRVTPEPRGGLPSLPEAPHTPPTLQPSSQAPSGLHGASSLCPLISWPCAARPRAPLQGLSPRCPQEGESRRVVSALGAEEPVSKGSGRFWVSSANPYSEALVRLLVRLLSWSPQAVTEQSRNRQQRHSGFFRPPKRGRENS